MLGMIRVRLTTVLERSGLLHKIQNISRIIARYTCRLIGARVFRHEVKRLLKGYENAHKEVLDLKEDLDNSSKKNGFFRAIHELAGYVLSSRSEVVAVSNRYGVDAADVEFLYNSLSDDDINEISSFVLSEHGYSKGEVEQILKQISYLARRLVHRKLGFILAHDPMFENAEDLLGHLHVVVLRVIREYEIQMITPQHMTARVAKSLKHQVVNMAERHGREKRQVVGRVREDRPDRILYHLDPQTGAVTEVLAFADQRLRHNQDGNILVAVKRRSTREWVVVHHKRLYETEDEAQHAWQLRSQGLRSKRDHYVDLSPQDIDDFQLNVLSIDVMDARVGSRPFADGCSSGERVFSVEDGRRERDILNSVNPQSRSFAELILNSAVDELFDAWCEEHGYNTATFDLAKMGRVACKYLGVTKRQLRIDLADTPAALWTDAQIGLISSCPSDMIVEY